ncbi:MAG: hypothetical protein GQ570_13455 [Helicobacteraceae bacterium]|nr:hypothetical protein [Helicobacteraceae bacterium]
MKSIEILIKYKAPKIIDAEKIFTNLKLFQEILFWARESFRELLVTNPKRYNLISKVDDIAGEIDSYMNAVRLKMLTNGKAGKNSLYFKLDNVELTLKWLISRWANVFMNIATNPKYKSFIDVSLLGYELNDKASHTKDALSIIINEEELAKCK